MSIISGLSVKYVSQSCTLTSLGELSDEPSDSDETDDEPSDSDETSSGMESDPGDAMSLFPSDSPVRWWLN